MRSEVPSFLYCLEKNSNCMVITNKQKVKPGCRLAKQGGLWSAPLKKLLFDFKATSFHSPEKILYSKFETVSL